MDINILRSAATVLVAIAFFAVCWWAFSPSRRKQFEEAAQLPFADEPDELQAVKKQSVNEEAEKTVSADQTKN